MAATPPTLPDLNALNPDALKALILAQHETLLSRETEIENLKLLILKLRRMQFGRKSEKLDRHQEDFGVLDEPVGNRGRNGRIKEDVAPVGKWRIGGDDGGPFVTVAGRDDLIKEVRGLLVECQIPKLVDKCSAEHLSTWTKPLRGNR
jgi:hypothetical protein